MELPIPVRRDIDQLIEQMTPEDRAAIRKMAESDLSRLHHGYGTRLRNQFRQREFPHLFRFCDGQVAADQRSFDSISSIAIRSIWRRLKEQPHED